MGYVQLRKEFGPAPINDRCPGCGVYPVDGYMSHLTSCPEREVERRIREHMQTQPVSLGLETEDEGRGQTQVWGEYLWGWIRWHWNNIDWASVLLAVVAIAIVAVFMWFALEAMEGN